MTSSLVGSEMCIRDRASPPSSEQAALAIEDEHPGVPLGLATPSQLASGGCLLYTSDAADDM
eukprot:632612-Prorocentrum_lima.AAC.1